MIFLEFKRLIIFSTITQYIFHPSQFNILLFLYDFLKKMSKPKTYTIPKERKHTQSTRQLVLPLSSITLSINQW